jgi:hypothetical protein
MTAVPEGTYLSWSSKTNRSRGAADWAYATGSNIDGIYVEEAPEDLGLEAGMAPYLREGGKPAAPSCKDVAFTWVISHKAVSRELSLTSHFHE